MLVCLLPSASLSLSLFLHMRVCVCVSLAHKICKRVTLLFLALGTVKYATVYVVCQRQRKLKQKIRIKQDEQKTRRETKKQ